MKSFELQVCHRGIWRTDSIYDDRNLAELEVRRMDDSSKYSGLRIIEETYDHKTDKTKIRTIYRDKRNQEKPTKKVKLNSKQRAVKASNQSRNRNYNSGRAPKKKPALNMTVILLKLMLIGFLGAAGLVALHFIRMMN